MESKSLEGDKSIDEIDFKLYLYTNSTFIQFSNFVTIKFDFIVQTELGRNAKIFHTELAKIYKSDLVSRKVKIDAVLFMYDQNGIELMKFSNHFKYIRKYRLLKDYLVEDLNYASFFHYFSSLCKGARVSGLILIQKTKNYFFLFIENYYLKLDESALFNSKLRLIIIFLNCLYYP